MQFPLLLTIFAISPSALALPVPGALPDATFQHNGILAQRLNTGFQFFNSTDACTTADNACIGTSMAICVASKWNVSACPDSLECFAIPSVQTNGTITTCTTQHNAESIITATGAKGGIFGSSSSSNSSASAPAVNETTTTQSSAHHRTVTHTVTVNPTSTPAPIASSTGDIVVEMSGLTTRTLNQSEASSLLASITRNPNFSGEVSTVVHTPTATAVHSALSSSVRASVVSTGSSSKTTAPPTIELN